MHFLPPTSGSCSKLPRRLPSLSKMLWPSRKSRPSRTSSPWKSFISKKKFAANLILRRSSATALLSSAPSPRSSSSRRRRPPCSSSAKPAPVKNSSPAPFTISVRAANAPSSKSIVPPFPPVCSNPSCSATNAAPSPVPSRKKSAASSSPIAVPSSSTKSATSRSSFSPSSSAFSKSTNSSASVATAPSASTFASSLPLTAIFPSSSPSALFAATSTTASTFSPSTSRRCASAVRTFLSSSAISSRNSADASTKPSSTFLPTQWTSSRTIPGPAISASSKISSSAPFFFHPAKSSVSRLLNSNPPRLQPQALNFFRPPQLPPPHQPPFCPHLQKPTANTSSVPCAKPNGASPVPKAQRLSSA